MQDPVKNTKTNKRFTSAVQKRTSVKTDCNSECLSTEMYTIRKFKADKTFETVEPEKLSQKEEIETQ